MVRFYTQSDRPWSDQPAICVKAVARSGFTLLELLLVLTIMAVVGSIAIPSLDKLLERQRLRGAADEMRLAWESARLKSMRTGQAQVFQCNIGANSFTVSPLILHDDEANLGDGGTVMSGGVALQTSSTEFGMSAAAAEPTGKEQTIDEELQFASCIVSGDLRASAVAQSGESAQINLQTVQQSVIFYPDGTTSTAELKIQNQRGDTVGVQIRGLTGHTRLLDLQVNAEGAVP